MDEKLKVLSEVAAKAEPIGEKRGIPIEEENAFLSAVWNDITYSIEKDKEANIRGTKQKGLEYSNTCVLFTLFALQRYLHVKFDIRRAVRALTPVGIDFETLDEIIRRSGLKWTLYRSKDESAIPKEHVTSILVKAATNLTCGMVMMRYKVNGEIVYHNSTFYPILADGTKIVRIIDCTGDISEFIMRPDTEVTEILEFTNPPATIPKELRGGKKTRRRKQKKRRSTHSFFTRYLINGKH